MRIRVACSGCCVERCVMQDETRGKRLQQGWGGREQRKASLRGMVVGLVVGGGGMVGKGVLCGGLPGLVAGDWEMRRVGL